MGFLCFGGKFVVFDNCYGFPSVEAIAIIKNN